MTKMMPERDLAADAYNQPSPVTTPVEAIMAKGIARRAWWLGPVIAAVAWFLGGSTAGWSAGIGTLIVVGNFILTGILMSRAAAVSLKVYHAAALLGFIGRLAFIALSMFAVASVVDVDRVALGVAAVVAYLGLLTLEAWAVLKGDRRELEWSS